jgi:hypothetical protein
VPARAIDENCFRDDILSISATAHRDYCSARLSHPTFRDLAKSLNNLTTYDAKKTFSAVFRSSHCLSDLLRKSMRSVISEMDASYEFPSLSW